MPSEFADAPMANNLVRGVILCGHVRGIQLTGFHQAHFAHDDAALLKVEPRSPIAFVIELRDEHLVALHAGCGRWPRSN